MAFQLGDMSQSQMSAYEMVVNESFLCQGMMYQEMDYMIETIRNRLGDGFLFHGVTRYRKNLRKLSNFFHAALDKIIDICST